MKNFNRFLLPLLGAVLFTASCDDDNAYIPEITDQPSVVVVNQGSMGYLPGTLDLLTLDDGNYASAVCEIEGSPQNLVECGGLLFIPQYEKNAVAVFDKSSLRSAGSISVPAPQSVCTDGKVIFAVGADSIFRISPATLSVEAKDTVGHTAYTSVYADGSVYVAIGRGMGQYEDGCYVAKVNPQTLKREYIQVGINPYNQMVADASGNVFVVCTGNYYDIPAAVYKVSPDGTTANICEGSYIDVSDGKLYVITRTSIYDANWQESSSCTFRTYDAGTGAALSSSFLASGEQPAAATFIKINPEDGDIYIGACGLTSSGYVSYTTDGYLYRYAADGTLTAKYNAGVSPYACLFVTRRVTH